MIPSRLIYWVKEETNSPLPLRVMAPMRLSVLVAFLACWGVMPAVCAISMSLMPDSASRMHARTVSRICPRGTLAGASAGRSAKRATSSLFPSSAVSMRNPITRARAENVCWVTLFAGQTTMICPGCNFRRAASTGRRLSRTMDCSRGTNWMSMSSLNHARSFTQSACPKNLVGPLAFIAKAAARFNFSAGSTSTFFGTYDATMSTLADRIGGAFIGGDTVDKASFGRIWKWLMFVLAHKVSITGMLQNQQSGFPLREVTCTL